MSLLDGEFAQQIADAFAGQLLTGQLRLTTTPASGALDRAGDPIGTLAQSFEPFEGFVDQFSAYTRAQPGFPQADLKLCIFGKSLADGVNPERDQIAQITGPSGSVFAGRWFQIRDRNIDPAGALWECQAFEIEAPQ